jgi:hypothetical protein
MSALAPTFRIFDLFHRPLIGQMLFGCFPRRSVSENLLSDGGNDQPPVEHIVLSIAGVRGKPKTIRPTAGLSKTVASNLSVMVQFLLRLRFLFYPDPVNAMQAPMVSCSRSSGSVISGLHPIREFAMFVKYGEFLRKRSSPRP